MDVLDKSYAKKLVTGLESGFDHATSTSNEDGSVTMTIYFTNNTNVPMTFNGVKGDKGENGIDGKGIKNISVKYVTVVDKEEVHLICTMTDDTEVDAGKIAEISNVYDDTALKTLIKNNNDSVNSKIGDITSLTVTSVSDLVSAINKLDKQFMQSVTFANSTVTLVYKNGAVFNIDVSPIITDTNVEELNNVVFTPNETTGNDNDVLMFNKASNKWVNMPYSTFDFLPVAKEYTDEQIAKMPHDKSKIVDTKPTVDKAEENIWYLYKVDGVWKETTYIDGVEVTIDTSSVDLSDVVKKTDIVNEFSSTPVDMTKIPTLNWYMGIHSLITQKIAEKINTTDIVDNFNSDATDKPASARTVKELNTNKVDKVSGKGLFSGSYNDLTNKPTIPTLSSSTASSSTTTAATSSAVKSVKDSLTSHTNSSSSHITTTERTNWNSVYNAYNNGSIGGSGGGSVEVVDNLMTDDGTKALSARQGYYMSMSLAGFKNMGSIASTPNMSGSWTFDAGKGGVTLYKKVVKWTPSSDFGNTTGITTMNIPHGITDLGPVLNVKALRYNNTSKTTNLLNGYIADNGFTTCVSEVNQTNIVLKTYKDTWSVSGYDFYFIIEYAPASNFNG